MHRGGLAGILAVSSDLADATATLKERDAGERGQPVHQLVLESRVTSLCCGRLSLPVVPVTAAHGCGGVIAGGEPCLREIALISPAQPGSLPGVMSFSVTRRSTGRGLLGGR